MTRLDYGTTMPQPAANQSALPHTPAADWHWALLEVGFIFLLFFVFAGSPPPDVGEAHYLAKSRHYWDPTWCRGDMFLESKDAHGVFYWTFGWVTRLASLTAAAWIGRCVTWMLLAWSWQRLSYAIAPQRLMSILTAGLLLLFTRWFHMAGEWIVGGVEAKGFAYVLVFLALEAVVRARWRLAFLLAGGATAFHVLVGGWTGLALAGAWLACGRQQMPLMKLAPALVVAAALAAVGIVPALALSHGADPTIVREANRIYVFERLSHHLVFHRFGLLFIARYTVLLLAWVALAWRTGCSDASNCRLHVVVCGAVAIAAIGVAIDQGLVVAGNLQGFSKEQYQVLAAPLLKYYWFRLSDSLVAVGVALAMGRLLAQSLAAHSAAGTWGLIAAMLAVALNLAEVGYARSQQRLPGSFLQPFPAESSAPEQAMTARERFQDWRNVCRWVAENTPADARCLTSRRQQTFKWYAGRAEVATWKDVPQDAASIVVWRGVIGELFPRGSGDQGLAYHSDAELSALARKFGAQYIVIDTLHSGRPIALPRVYPQFPWENPAFAVYRIPPAGVP